MVPNIDNSRQGEVCVDYASGRHKLGLRFLALLCAAFLLVLNAGVASAQTGYGKRWHRQKVDLEAAPISATQIQLTWHISNQEGEIYAIRVYRAQPLNPGYLEFIQQLQATAVTFNDSGLKPNSKYSYQIQPTAKKPIQKVGGPSNVAEAVTLDPNAEGNVPISLNVPRYTVQDPGIRSAIKTLSAKAIASNQIQLKWGMPFMQKVASLRVFRNDPENPTEFLLLQAIGAHLTTWVDDSVFPNKSYSYIIRYNVGHGALLSPPSNVAVATTPAGAPPPPDAKVKRPNYATNFNANQTTNIQGKPVILAPVGPIPPGGIGTAIPLDSREEEFFNLLNACRAEKGAGPVRPSITITKAADAFAKEMAETGNISKVDRDGRSTRARLRGWGYDVDTVVDTVVMATRGLPEDVLYYLKQSGRDNDILLNPIWKTIGLARGYDERTGNWVWVLDFSAFWDYTIPLPGEDEDGRIDGNELIRTRPSKEALAEGQTFTGYGDDNKPYATLHCNNVTKDCWKDPIPQGNLALDELSDPDFLPGLWHVEIEITPSGIMHFNDPNGYDLTEFTMTLQLNKDGTWVSQGYRAYQRPTPIEAGTWKSVHDISRNEELVTFYRDNGKPMAQLRVHATKNRLTFFVCDGGPETRNFYKNYPADYDKKDDQQVIFTPGKGFFLGPHEPFPETLRCGSCPSTR